MLRSEKAAILMTRLPFALPFASLLALGACTGDGNPDVGADQVPRRTDWLTVVDGAVLPGECPLGADGCECGTGSACDTGSCLETNDGEFCVGAGAKGEKGGQCDDGTCAPGLICSPLVQDPGTSVCIDPPNDEVTSLTIGGTPVAENFINRGDIEVFFTGNEGEITVQLRKFTFAADDAAADTAWGRLHSWAYSGSVVPPGPDNVEEDCTLAFRNGCSIRVWYEGMVQPKRDGADIRVILPPSYAGNLDIITEDNIEDSEYQDRGDVTIKDLKGTADIEVDSGNVTVSMASDVLEAPACGAEAIQICEDFEIEDPENPGEMIPAPWDLTCGCSDFGKVRVETRPERASNITIDMPGDLWATARMENSQAGLTSDSDPLCTAEADCNGIDDCEDLNYDSAFPWKRDTEFNDPGDSAVEGVGYSFDMNSQACQNVAYSTGPDNYGEEEEVEKRGDLLLCSGCVDIAGP
jgi:hypothetical protein